MFQNGISNLLSNLPKNLKSLPNLEGMLGGIKPPSDPTDLPQGDLQKFGNWTNQTDTKLMAADLKRRGLIGAQQLIDDQPNVNSASSIRNSQSDWKVNAVQQILSNAKKFNLRTPAEVMANKDILITKPEWKDAINNDSFKTIHPNFWDVISKSILPEQYAKFDKQNSVAKK